MVYECEILENDGQCTDCCVKGETVIDRVHPKMKAKYGKIVGYGAWSLVIVAGKAECPECNNWYDFDISNPTVCNC